MNIASALSEERVEGVTLGLNCASKLHKAFSRNKIAAIVILLRRDLRKFGTISSCPSDAP